MAYRASPPNGSGCRIPVPDVLINSIDLVAAPGREQPFVVAVTAE